MRKTCKFKCHKLRAVLTQQFTNHSDDHVPVHFYFVANKMKTRDVY